MWRQWIVLCLAIGCGGGGAASVDGGMRDATPDVRDASAPVPEPTSCTVVTTDPKDLCGGAPGCVQRRVVGLRCSRTFHLPDLALAPDGRALIALATTGRDDAAFLLEVPPVGEAKVWPLGPAEAALVAVGADGEPRVLLWSPPHEARLLARAGASFTSQSISMLGVPRGFVIGAGGVPFTLTTDELEVVRLTRLDGVNSTSQVVTTGRLSWMDLFVDGAGVPTVAYAVIKAGERLYSRWTAGTTTELGRMASPGEDDTAAALLADGRLRLARTERGSLLLFGDGVMERPLYQAPAWTTPTCAGFMIAYYPDVCPGAVEGDMDVGEHVMPSHALAASASGALFAATSTAHVRVGCGWRAPSCIERMPCECSNVPYEKPAAPYAFRIRAVDGTAPAWTLLTPGGLYAPGYAIDGSGAHHLLWYGVDDLTLTTFELRAP